MSHVLTYNSFYLRALTPNWRRLILCVLDSKGFQKNNLNYASQLLAMKYHVCKSSKAARNLTKHWKRSAYLKL